ncbi:hypothetical protein [uncultured Ruegeria sp.]|uniref:hypothetical protein n=1 Tax=uncultured Ruegeria sp. TaxID=259304 RepID=UPI00262F15E7|nr:hypothetical protein [uncultured Ruegeria sp.]
MTGTPKGAKWLIKDTLNCDDETAEAVRLNLAGVLDHRPTRAFLAIAWHLANTTHPVKGSRDQTLINEGKRMAGLFLVQCAEAGLDLNLYAVPKENDP